MLVLSRKKNECIIIGDSITVTVLEVRGNRVRIGIHAPSEVPIQRQQVAEAATAERDPANSLAERSSPEENRDRNLLVVSNDDQTRANLAGILAGDGGNVDTAPSSLAALEYVDERPYDVVIIDEQLRRARGAELFERMRVHQSGLKGILCSNRPTHATVEAALDSGIDHVVQKPFDPNELLSLVSS